MNDAEQPTDYGGKLHHAIPEWVDRDEAIFHIRIRSASNLTAEPETAQQLLDSVAFYADSSIWLPGLFLLMPDHLHALLSVHPERNMSRVIGDWKKWHTINTGIDWQEGYFDHRLRKEESFDEKAHYIRNNPVAAGLCQSPEAWPWWLSTSLVDGPLTKGYNDV